MRGIPEPRCTLAEAVHNYSATSQELERAIIDLGRYERQSPSTGARAHHCYGRVS
jgi:hypothetical protein